MPLSEALGSKTMKEIIDEIDSRIKSPFFGYFLFSLVAFNWEEIFYLIVDIGSVSQRIEYFHKGTDVYTLLVYPFLAASAYAIIYPWLNYFFMKLSTKPSELRNTLQAESEHKLIEKKQELEEARSEALKSAENELIDRAKRDASLDEIKDENSRKNLQSEIEKLRKDRDALSASIQDSKNSNSHSLSKEQIEILRLITSNGGSLFESGIVKESTFDKVKTEYLLEDLEAQGYLEKGFHNGAEEYYYDLTLKSKKLMVEKGFAK